MEVTVLWAGGWDEYLIDPAEQRLALDHEIAKRDERVAKGWGTDPVVGDREWLWGYMISPRDQKEMGVSHDRDDHILYGIVRYIRGGD